MRPSLLAAIAAALAAATPVPPTGASTVVPLSLADLATRAERIFHGTCLQTAAESVDGEIATRVTFAVAEGLKGTAADTLVLWLPGGQLGGVRDEIAGMPAFAPGDEVVLFVTETDAIGRVWPVGLGQGHFRVQRGDDRPASVSRDLQGLHPPAGAARPAGPRAPTSLDDLLGQVRALVGDPARDPAR